MAWLGASGLADVGALVSGRLWQNSQPVVRVWLLFGVVLAMEALAAYQHSRQRAAVFRMAMGGFVIAWLVLLATVEPIARYSAFTAPLHGMVILVASAATVFRRVSLTRRDLLVDSGFLISVGLMAYAVPASLQTLVAQLSVNSAPQLGVVFYAMSSVVSILAALIFVRAIMVARHDVARVHS